MPRILRSPFAGALLDGVNVASLALMAVVTFELGRTTIMNWWMFGLAVVSLAVLHLVTISNLRLVSTKMNFTWLSLAGVVVGLLVGSYGASSVVR